MTEFPNEWDPKQPGSRFTSRPALAIRSRRAGTSRFRPLEDTGDAAEVVVDALGDALGDHSALGVPRVVDGSDGRGAAAWVPVVEWALELAIPGVIGGAAWAGVARGARWARQLVVRLHRDQVQFYVSRGFAALIAIGYVLDEGLEYGVLDVELVEKLSRFGGRGVSELNYVGAEAWLVALLNEDRSRRYIVAVSPEGEAQGALALPVSEIERVYLGLPPRDA